MRLEVIWLYPVLPPSQFVVTGPRGRAVLDPPTFALSVELADGTTEELPGAGGQDRGLLRAPAQPVRRPLPGGHRARPRARRGAREPGARAAHRGGRGPDRRGALVIDFHVHQPAGDAYGPAAYADFAAALGVELSVTFTYDGLRKPGAAANDSLAAFVADGGKRFVAFANVDPNDPGAADEIPPVRARARNAGRQAPPLDPGLLGRTLPGSILSARPRPLSGSRSSSTTERRRTARRSSSRRSRAGIRGR